LDRGATLATARRLILSSALLALLALAIPAGAADTRFPDPVGYVNDFASVLSESDREAIEAYLQRLEDVSGIQGALVTLPSIGDRTVDDAANLLYEQWGIGKKGKDRGFLLLDAIAERQFRIEIGYGLEGALPDGKVGEIRDRYAIPNLKEGRRAEAYVSTLRAIVPIALGEVGIDPARADSLMEELPQFSRHAASARHFPFPLPILVIILMIVASLGRGRRGRGLWGGPWIFPGGFGGMGGFGGGGGGGGGFGGFGGGSSGGGGASGGY
jgi:uncharacterized protein